MIRTVARAWTTAAVGAGVEGADAASAVAASQNMT
jgi:hypothetical protein